MTDANREELELIIIDIHDFTTLFDVILSHKTSARFMKTQNMKKGNDGKKVHTVQNATFRLLSRFMLSSSTSSLPLFFA